MAPEMVVSPVTLEGAQVRLEPLAKTHLAGLAEVGLDEELWRWIPTAVRTREEMAGDIETGLQGQKRCISLPFLIFGEAAGRKNCSTTYRNIYRTPHRFETVWGRGVPRLEQKRCETAA